MATTGNGAELRPVVFMEDFISKGLQKIPSMPQLFPTFTTSTSSPAAIAAHLDYLTWSPCFRPCLNTVCSQHRYQNLPPKIGQDCCYIGAQNALVASHLMRTKSRDPRIGHQGSGPPLLLFILTSVPPRPIARSAPAMLLWLGYSSPRCLSFFNWPLNSLPHHLQFLARMLPPP